MCLARELACQAELHHGVSTVNAVRHAHSARALIEAAGGFVEAATLCRVKKSILQACCVAGSGKYLAIDVVDDLERAVGQRIYTDALRREPGTQVDLEDLIEEAAAMTEVAAEAQGLVRRCARDGKFDAKERQAMRRTASKVRDQVAGFLTVADGVAA
jgi:hypothetical protein